MPEWGPPKGSTFVLASHESRLRLRLWVEGELVDEAWVGPADDMELVSARQERMAKEATDAGQVFMAEAYDPDLPESQAYLRFGTDPRGRVAPTPGATAEDLEAEIDRRWRPGA